jgi:hypothetical protein
MLTHNIYSCFLYLTIPIPLAVPWALANWRRAPALFLAAPVAFVIGVRLLPDPGRGVPWALVASFVAAAALADLYAHFPIKYLLPVCPAVVLVLFRLSSGVSARVATVCGALLVAAGTAYSCLILEAGYRFANVSRTAARELVEPRVAAGESVWFAGQWGFYWYAQRAGAQLTRPDGPGPFPGDLLAIPTGLAGSATTLNRIPNRTLVRDYAETCACGRTMTDGGALYTNVLGNLLWVWSRGPLDRFELWRTDWCACYSENPEWRDATHRRRAWAVCW